MTFKNVRTIEWMYGRCMVGMEITQFAIDSDGGIETSENIWPHI